MAHEEANQETQQVVVKVTRRVIRRKGVVNAREVLWETAKITGVVSGIGLVLASLTPRPFFFAKNIAIWTFVTALSYKCVYTNSSVSFP
jgi:hypothetical protein